MFISPRPELQRIQSAFVTMLFVLCLLHAPAQVQAAEPALTIVKDGKARAQLVLSETPSRKTRVAADELQKFFKLISGAELPIVNTPDAGTLITIYVGQSEAANKLNLPKNTYKNGAYHIASGDNWIALFGDEKDYEPIEPYGKFRGAGETKRVNEEWKKITGEPFYTPAYNLYIYYYDKPGIWLFDGGGVLNAAYHLLRSQGCEWYMAGDIGQYVPKADTITLPSLNRDFIPDFKMRDLSFFHDHLGVSEDEAMWRLRVGVQGRDGIMGITQPAHGSKFIHMSQEMRDLHPDMFAILKGKRNAEHAGIGYPCLSSQTFFDMHVKFIRAMFDHYKQPAINIDLVDGYAFLCECDQCRTLGTPERNWNGSMSDYVWGYLNRVAKEVYKTHPDKMLFGLSYSSYQLPPEKIEQLSPNLGVIICQTRSNIYNDFERKRVEDVRQQWLKKLPSGQMYNWDYYMHNWAPRRPYAFMPTYFPDMIAKDMRSLKGVAQGELVEIYDHKNPADYEWAAQAVNHLNIFVTTRLYWDADADVSQMLEDFYTHFYGPARAEMKAYIEYCQEHWRAMRNDITSIDESNALLAKAVKAAGEDNIYRERIDLIVTYTKPMEQLRAQLAKGRDDSMGVRSLLRDPKTVKIDGKLDDAMWQSVRKYELRELQTGRNVKNGTTVYIAWAGDSLYLGLRCEEPDTKKLERENVGNDNPSIYQYDNIDILLETQVHAYYQLTFTPLGELLDMDRANGLRTEWSSNAVVATHIGDGYWSAEVRLPAAGDEAAELNAIVGIAGHTPSSTYPWYINILRQSIDKDGVELSALNPTGGKFHTPAKMAKVYNK